MMERQFSQFIYGTLEREEPIDVELLSDRLVLDWGMWFWKAHKEIPWRELSIVSPASVWLGDHPNWKRYGIALRWDTWAEEQHKGWKRIWLPCKPGSPFYEEVQRMVAIAHSAPPV